ncbi:MAG: hypothetical protein JRH19_01970 [Deltaproteobacteria bacterium]|nr:hypothetical protein [Deltaproteobacteria bacterium]
MKPATRRVLGVAVAAALVAFVLPLYRRSINLSDEGYLLLQALDLLEGKVLYRDMDAFVTPGIWILLAGLFKIVEPSVLASRWVSLGAYLASVAVAARIAMHFAGRSAGPRLALATTAAFAVFSVWAFPVWTYAFYSPFGVLFSLAGAERLLTWNAGRHRRDLVLAGLAFGLAIAFKQNYGTFAVLGAGLGLIALHVSEGRGRATALGGLAVCVAGVSAGVLAVAGCVIAYLLAQGSLAAAFESLIVHPFVFAGQHDVPYPSVGLLWASEPFVGADRLTYGAYSLYTTRTPAEWVRWARLLERLHILLYAAAPLVLASAAVLTLRGLPRREPAARDLALLLGVCGGLFLGVFPRADYNHLINVYPALLVLGAVTLHGFAQLAPRPRPLWLRGITVAGVSLALVYVAVAAHWYVAQITSLSKPLHVRRGGVLVRPEQAEALHTLVSIVQGESEPGDTLLTVPDLSMVNFLSERSMPSPYYNLYQHHIGHDGGAGVVAGAEATRAPLAVTRYSNFFSDRVGLRDYAPALTDYLATHFSLDYGVANDDFLVLRRRPLPVPRLPALAILEHCGSTPGMRGDQEVRSHLLFDVLYQDNGNRHLAPRHRVVARCRLRVPHGAPALRLRVGYWPPELADPGASITAEVLALHDGGSETLLEVPLPIVPMESPELLRSFPPEHSVDLSHLAGREITLVLRSTRQGRVQRNPFAYKSFSLMWIEPRIE